MRYRIATCSLALAVCTAVSLRAQPPHLHNVLTAFPEISGSSLDDSPLVPQSPFAEAEYPQTLDDYAIDTGFAYDALCPPTDYLPALRWFGLRHAHTHGRHVGRGGPLVGSSWLNRPYYVGAELGTLWITDNIYDDIAPETDTFGGIMLGWNRDPYWGAELRFDWATPELINPDAPDADRTDSLFVWSYNLLYYPWGDATWRPYWRAGIGNARFDFPLDDGLRHDQRQLVFPIGFGVKYPVRRWLAARAEFTDHVGVGHYRVNAGHHVALTFGLEWHFGAHPRSYWPWQPSRHIW